MRDQRSDRSRLRPSFIFRPLALFILAALTAGCSAVPRISLPSALLQFSGGAAKAASDAPASVPTVVVPKAGDSLPSAPAAPDLTGLQERIANYLGQQEGTYGVYVIDIASGEATGVNADQVFPSASTFKLPMSMYILNQVEHGRASLDELLTYTGDDYEDGTGTLQDTVVDGDQYSIRRLIDLAITQSDNIATNMLLRRFGRENVFAYERSLGGKVTLYDSNTIGTTPREMATYMQLAYGKTAISNSKLRQFLLDLLSNTAFDDRTAAGVPQGVKVAHKIGTLPGIVNDVALVYAPRRTFVVAVYSIDVEEDTAAGVISDVTRKVYDFERELAQATPSSSGQKMQ